MPRPRAWADNLIGIVLSGDGVQASPVDLLSELVPADTIMVVRLVGHLYVFPQTLTQTGNYITAVDLGIGVASIEAFNIAGGLLDPNQAGDVPIRNWLWRDRLLIAHENDGGTEDSYKSWPEVRFDIRAMRKVDRGRLYLSAVASLSTGTFSTVQLLGSVRALCLT